LAALGIKVTKSALHRFGAPFLRQMRELEISQVFAGASDKGQEFGRDSHE
jgi:hypothetical protein